MRALSTLMDAKRDPDADVSGLLGAWVGGDVEARDQLLMVVYQELRRRAAAHLRRERAGHTLQPTALVHEVYLRLVKQDRAAWQNRAQFFGVASQMMRRILVDRARARNRAKRSGGWARVTLDEEVAQSQEREVDVLDLDRALSELATFDTRKSQVAELRFFGGLSLEETGHALGLSVATLEREWQATRAWLYARLTGEAGRSQFD
jgi:RNA polymerase sigma-70 factor, ECF subfamily